MLQRLFLSITGKLIIQLINTDRTEVWFPHQRIRSSAGSVFSFGLVQQWITCLHPTQCSCMYKCTKPSSRSSNQPEVASIVRRICTWTRWKEKGRQPSRMHIPSVHRLYAPVVAGSCGDCANYKQTTICAHQFWAPSHQRQLCIKSFKLTETWTG